MYSLPYVALRYFNVYGPRMDIEGKDTEVLIRWMERLDTGQPPLIYGDGSQTMDFVYVDDAARATILALASNVSDEVLNVASGVETPERARRRAVARHERAAPVRARARAQGQRGDAPPCGNGTGRADARLSAAASSGPPGRMVAHGASARVTAVRTLIPVARPALGEREADAARRAILSGWVSQGPEVARSNGSSPRRWTHPCLRGVELHDGAAPRPRGSWCWTGRRGRHGEPFVHRHGQRRRYCGATPVFVDVELDTFNVDVSQLEAAIGPRTRAILAVHQLGMPCDLRAITSIAGRHKLPVIEDAACAIGSEVRWDGAWQPIGRPHGDVACFLFHPRKLLSTGDGGMLTTRNEELDRRFVCCGSTG